MFVSGPNRVKVYNMYALELGKTRFLRWLDMSCRLKIYRFYVGESTISRIISDLNFPPLCQNRSRKCKQTWIKLSPKFVFSLCCLISNEWWEPPNEREETRTPIPSLHTSDVILTNQTDCTMMTLYSADEYFLGPTKPGIPYFHRRRSSFALAFIVGGSMKFRKFHANRTYIRKFQKTAASIFTVKTNEITRKLLILCSSVSDKWQKTLKTPKKVGGPVGKEGVLGGGK